MAMVEEVVVLPFAVVTVVMAPLVPVDTVLVVVS